MIQNRAFTRDELEGTNVAHVMDPGHDLEIEVPGAIGKQVEAAIHPQVEAASKGLLDANNWNITVTRADGHKDWATAKDLINSKVTSHTSNASHVETDLMHRVCVASIDCALVFQSV